MAALKVATGWRVLRLVARDKEIVGGAQLLLKQKRGLGVAFVTRGPVIASQADVAPALIERFKVTASAEKVRFVLAQPPASPATLADELCAHGFRASWVSAARKGVKVRRGGESDIATFHRLVKCNCGIDGEVAQCVLAGRPVPADAHSVSRFKLGFGGQVVLSPGTYDWANGLLARSMRTVGSGLADRNMLTGLTARLRGAE